MQVSKAFFIHVDIVSALTLISEICSRFFQFISCSAEFHPSVLKFIWVLFARPVKEGPITQARFVLAFTFLVGCLWITNFLLFYSVIYFRSLFYLSKNINFFLHFNFIYFYFCIFSWLSSLFVILSTSNSVCAFLLFSNLSLSPLFLSLSLSSFPISLPLSLSSLPDVMCKATIANSICDKNSICTDRWAQVKLMGGGGGWRECPHNSYNGRMPLLRISW